MAWTDPKVNWVNGDAVPYTEFNAMNNNILAVGGWTPLTVVLTGGAVSKNFDIKYNLMPDGSVKLVWPTLFFDGHSNAKPGYSICN